MRASREERHDDERIISCTPDLYGRELYIVNSMYWEMTVANWKVECREVCWSGMLCANGCGVRCEYYIVF